MGNFEAKHPRGFAGRFVEKLRGEAGFSLQALPEEDIDYFASNPGCARQLVKEVQTDDKDHIRRKYRVWNGYLEEDYRPDNSLFSRLVLDENGDDVRSTTTPHFINFNEDGSIYSVSYAPTLDQVKEHFETSDEPLIVSKMQWGKELKTCARYDKTKSGDIQKTYFSYYDDGRIKRIERNDLYDRPESYDGQPYNEFYSENGNLEQDWVKSEGLKPGERYLMHRWTRPDGTIRSEVWSDGCAWGDGPTQFEYDEKGNMTRAYGYTELV